MRSILIIEDNEMNRDMLSRRLVRRGFDVRVAEDGPQGLAAARDRRPSLILLDLSLPGMDGWEAARQLKRDPATQTIPVIALTAHAMADDRAQALEAGCDDYDTKPVEIERLVGKMMPAARDVGAHARGGCASRRSRACRDRAVP
jgi:CheY-like chemotaxis protein